MRLEQRCCITNCRPAQATLGFGVLRQWGAITGSLVGLRIQPDKYLSVQAFQSSMASHQRHHHQDHQPDLFEAYLPLYLNPSHGSRSLKLLPSCVANILAPEVTSGQLVRGSNQDPIMLQDLHTGPHPHMAPRDLLTVIAHLTHCGISQLLVSTDPQHPGPGSALSQSDSLAHPPPTRVQLQQHEEQQPLHQPPHPHTFRTSSSAAAAEVQDASVSHVSRADEGVSPSLSDTTLQALCHLHHLMLSASLQPGSQLRQVALEDVQLFARSEGARHKSRCPDLGLLLVEYLLVPKEVVPWSDLAPGLIREVLARQVRGAIRDAGEAFGRPYVEVSNKDGTSAEDDARLQRHFQAASADLRVLMGLAWLVNALPRPRSVEDWQAELESVRDTYDGVCGLPPIGMFGAFERHVRRAKACQGWSEFLVALNLGMRRWPGQSFRKVWVNVLRQSVVDSYRYGYHHLPALLPAGDGAGGSGQQGGRGAMKGTKSFVRWQELQPVGVVGDVWV